MKDLSSQKWKHLTNNLHNNLFVVIENIMETYFKISRTFPLLCHINVPLKKHAWNKFPRSFLPTQNIYNLQ